MDKKLLEALAARAEQKEKSRTETKEFDLGGVKAMFVKPSQKDQLAIYESMSEATGAGDLVELSTALIYDCCPDLQDTELHKALGVTDPYDTVRKLLDVHEIDVLGGLLMGWIGLLPQEAKEKIEDMAKNS